MNINIKNLIYKINDQNIILISDVAFLYGVETKVINQIIKRHLDSFDEYDYFMLDDTEYQNFINQIENLRSQNATSKDNLRSQNVILRSQIVTSKDEKRDPRGGTRYNPFVFTEDGFRTFLSVYKSKKNLEIGEQILDAFVSKRNMQSLGKAYNIEDLIYEVRGVQVMLDSDLAYLYKCKNGTKDINKAVNRNIERFPENFYFELTRDECSRFQIGTLNETKGGNLKYLPHVFTEQGVAMLSAVLHTETAINMSVKIINAFVAMRKFIKNNSNLFNEFEDYKRLTHQNSLDIDENKKDIKILKEFYDKYNIEPKTNQIFFEGQIFDSYLFFLDLLESAKEEIIIIDNYAGKELFKLISKINKKIIIVSKNIDEELITKYKKQYSNMEFILNDFFHDRFIIIDRNTLYHSGASFKDLGDKCSALNLMNDKTILNMILKNILNNKEDD